MLVLSAFGWFINNRNLLLTVLEAGSPKAGRQRGRVLLRTLLLVANCQLLMASSHGDGAWELRRPLYEAIGPIHEGGPSSPP